jgi:hypothetical protein
MEAVADCQIRLRTTQTPPGGRRRGLLILGDVSGEDDAAHAATCEEAADRPRAAAIEGTSSAL